MCPLPMLHSPPPYTYHTLFSSNKGGQGLVHERVFGGGFGRRSSLTKSLKLPSPAWSEAGDPSLHGAVGELVVKGGVVGLENPPQIEADAPDSDLTRRLIRSMSSRAARWDSGTVGFAVMVGLWVVYGGLWWICGGGIAGFAVMVGLWVVYGGLWWISGGLRWWDCGF
uniref:Uncharacterized protein n=1 Tax=Fagus sylvatica TaxID=28930 RepID=A0A2N9HH32_FAGSY